MKKGLTVMLCMFFMMSIVVATAQYSSAETIDNAVPLAVQDNTGENIGPVDLLAAQAAIYQRKIGGGPANEKLLKLTIKTTPNLPGAMIFEADLDNSTGTGGTISQIGAPVTPCPCKITPGFDIALTIYHRKQGDSSGSAFCASCSDGNGSCGTERKAGEWYVLTSISGQPVRALGFLRGYADPTPGVVGGDPVQTSYTFPWGDIIAYANAHLAGTPGRFNIGIYYDATDYTTGLDDITTSTGPGPLDLKFDVCDWAPDGDGNVADMIAADFLTYCEGNFDQDSDVDGTDAATLKRNFGRSRFHRVCPDANAYY
jgi:hypothetical protein